jgi:hypothetical protein
MMRPGSSGGFGERGFPKTPLGTTASSARRSGLTEEADGVSFGPRTREGRRSSRLGHRHSRGASKCLSKYVSTGQSEFSERAGIAGARSQGPHRPIHPMREKVLPAHRDPVKNNGRL